MKHLGALVLILLSTLSVAQTTPPDSHSEPPCLIVKHTSVAHQMFVRGNNWQYVAGEFPQGMKWKSNITDGLIRKVKEKGGRVVIVPTNYSATDLDHAKAECRQPDEHTNTANPPKNK